MVDKIMGEVFSWWLPASPGFYSKQCCLSTRHNRGGAPARITGKGMTMMNHGVTVFVLINVYDSPPGRQMAELVSNQQDAVKPAVSNVKKNKKCECVCLLWWYSTRPPLGTTSARVVDMNCVGRRHPSISFVHCSLPVSPPAYLPCNVILPSSCTSQL